MKKLIVLNIFLLIIICNVKNAYAATDYENYQEMNFQDGGQLLVDMNVGDYYDNIKKRKFMGWNIHYINKRAKVTYKTDTLLDYYNSGTSPIKYEYKMSKKDQTCFSVSVVDNLELVCEGKIKKLDASLSNKLKIESEYGKTLEVDEETKISIDIDPKTQLIIYTYGEGYITNGVAAKYICWIRSQRGGFEYFEPTTQYTKVIKRKIR